MEREQIERAVRRVRARLVARFLLKWLSMGLVASMFTGSLLLLVSRWLIVPNYRWWAIGIALVLFIVIAIFGWLNRPTWREAVRYIDEPTENRVSTALKYAEDSSVIAALQRQETVQAANQFLRKLRSLLPLTLPRRWGIALISFFILFIALWVLPNPADEVLAKKEVEEQWINEQADKVNELLDEHKEKLEQEDVLPITHEIREEMIAELEALLQELKQQDVALDALMRLEEMLERLKASLHQIEKEKVKAEQEQARLNDQVGSGNDQQSAEAAEGAEQLAHLQKEVEDLARRLAEMGLAAARELSEQGLPVSNAWRDGGLAAELSQRPRSGEGNDNPAQGSSGDAGEGSNGDVSAGEGTAVDGENGGQSSSGEGGAGEGSGTGGESGAESGEGSGTGAGQGQGSSSGGLSGGSQGGLQGGTGAGDRNMIRTPRIFEGESEPEVDGGPVRGEGGETEHTSRAPAEAGTAAPYEQVYGVYEQEARQSVERIPVPDSLKQMVKDYFTTISPAP